MKKQNTLNKSVCQRSGLVAEGGLNGNTLPFCPRRSKNRRRNSRQTKMESRPSRTRSISKKYRLKSKTNLSKMPRPRQSNANRNGKKKRILLNRSHLRKIRQTPRRRTIKSHHPRTHAHPKIIRWRIHPPRQSPRRISQPRLQ